MQPFLKAGGRTDCRKEVRTRKPRQQSGHKPVFVGDVSERVCFVLCAFQLISAYPTKYKSPNLAQHKKEWTLFAQPGKT